MLKTKYKILTFLCLLMSLSSTWGRAETRLEVIVGVPPHAYLAEKIGGDFLQVQVLLAQGQDPHTFEPSPKQVMSLGAGRVFFSAGLEFEQRLITKIKGNFAELVVVDLSERSSLKAGQLNQHHEHFEHHDHHDHNDQHGHDHDSHSLEDDPHTWLSLRLLHAQAKKMAAVLSRIDPLHSREYQENLDGFLLNLAKVRGRIEEKLSPFEGRTFFVFHPAFAHFGADFGLVQKAVEAGGRVPSPREIADLISKAKREKVKIIFVQPQFDHASAQVIAASIGGIVVEMDPLARDIMGNFVDMAEKMERAFQ